MSDLYRIASVIVLTCILALTTNCKKEDPAKLATVSTTPVTDISTTMATGGGTIINNGGAEIVANGVCWSTSINPLTTNSKTVDKAGAAQFVSSMNDLTAGTAYHVRAYATNSAGTAYGDDLSFTTLGQAPTVLTQSATNITLTGATLNGTVNANYLSTMVIFEFGLTASYGQTITAIQSPVKGNTDTVVSAEITGLTSATAYHFRVKTTNSIGTVYGEDLSFYSLTDHTGETGTVEDDDGNVYQTTGIGSQIWMAENLKTTKFNDGTDIPNITEPSVWTGLTAPAYCWYSNDPVTYNTYGALYNWYTVVGVTNGNKNVCPVGWHVPSDTEWAILTTFLGGEGVAGGKLKETGIIHWQSPNTDATDEYGFTALPAGCRASYGAFFDLGIYAYWWLSAETGSTQALFRFIEYGNGSIGTKSYAKISGLSIRCLKN